MTTKDTTNCLEQSFISVLPLLQLPNGVLQHGVTKWLSLSDCASLGISSKDLKAAVEVYQPYYTIEHTAMATARVSCQQNLDIASQMSDNSDRTSALALETVRSIF